ncbi:hypothetical protein [Cyclobacterium sp. SYSU L10401]|uniref:hypothetical protein n=1 Tax=Cyclobacterium sp. SYSU L10401 TaxID=2678657 RepID=UPI0013D7AF1E|nr:hypothetical protein [Cyclobacterium sp. SYSU L10401]
MKNRLRPFAKYMAVLLMIAPLIYWGCGTKELEFVPPYQEVEDEFDDIADLPEVDDPDPEFTEPVYEELSTPPLVSNLLEEVMAYEEEGKAISDNARQELKRLKLGLKEMGLDLDAQIESGHLAGILDLEASLDEDLDALMASFMEKYGLKAPLPEIPEVGDLPDIEALESALKKDILAGSNARVMSDIYGPCFQHAREAYDDRVYDLDDQLNSAVDRINANYLRRAEQAEERLMRRNEQVNELYMEERNLLHELSARILRAAVRAGLDGDLELAEELRAYALIYAYHMRIQIKEWALSCVAWNETFFNREIEKIEELRESRIARVLTFHEEAVELADRLLNAAFDRCHDQGGGN